MNSEGKAATFAVVILAAACVLFALKLVGKYEDAKVRISELETRVAGLEKDVADLKSQKAALEVALESEKKARETAEAEVERTKEMNVQLTKQLEQERDKLAKAMDEVGKTKAELETATGERRDAQSKLDKAVADMSDLKRELEKLQKLAGVAAAASPSQGRKIEGTVVAVCEPNFVTIDLGQEATEGLQTVLFVHRGDQVVGKVKMAKVYNTTLAAEVSDPSALAAIRKNDHVRLRSEQPVEVFAVVEGKVGTKHPHGFVSIDVEPECAAGFRPTFEVTRGDEQIGQIEVKRISYAGVVAELVDGETIAKIQQNDELKAPR